MRARQIRQQELFDDRPLDKRPVLPAETLEQVRQLLMQWLGNLSETMSQEVRDEQDLAQIHVQKVAGIQGASLHDQTLREFEVDFPISIRKRIGHYRSSRSLCQTHVIQLAGLSRQTDLDIAQALPVGQLRKGQDSKLIQTTERPHASVALMSHHDATECFPGQKIQQLRKQGWGCELPAQLGVPLSRWSTVELTRRLLESGLVSQVSATTAWRWLNQNAIRPRFHRCWIFPRDLDFAAKAGRLLDLYQRRWQGQPLRADEFLISADEKTSIQARQRIHPTAAPAPGMPMKVEHEYERCGSIACIAAWDVHRARVFGRCEDTTGIVAFDQLVDQFISQSPYRQARRVFWIVDNSSPYRGARSVKRLQDRYHNLMLIHSPVYAS